MLRNKASNKAVSDSNLFSHFQELKALKSSLPSSIGLNCCMISWT